MKFNIEWIEWFYKSIDRDPSKVKLRWYTYIILAIPWIAFAYWMGSPW